MAKTEKELTPAEYWIVKWKAGIKRNLTIAEYESINEAIDLKLKELKVT